jgi:hypothetical protein
MSHAHCSRIASSFGDRPVHGHHRASSVLDPTDVEAARTDALTLFGSMIGTVQLARAPTDRDLSDQLLAKAWRPPRSC